MKTEHSTATNNDTADQITFHNVQSESNIVKGEFEKNGQTHTIYLLAVPESNLKDHTNTKNCHSVAEM